MEFKVLGPLEIVDGMRELVPTAPKLRAVLALLILRHGRVVLTNELIDELWGDDPPASALPTLQTYIYKLRKILDNEGRLGDGLLQTKPYGYVLTIPDEDVDLSRFEHLAEEGRRALDDGDAERAAGVLSQALSLWRGQALADIAVGEILSAQITRLEEARLRALEFRLDADMELGRHRVLISELKALTLAFPLHEGFHAKLMVALYRSGRRYEALDVYQHLRGVLVRELGLEPSSNMGRLQQAVLASDPQLDPAPPPPRVTVAVASPAPKGATGASPAQLPPDIADFSGRTAFVRRIEHLLLAEDGESTSTRIISITGPPGVGKTAAAVHLAHRVCERFPGGQLFADLSGTGTAYVDPFAILGGFLTAGGIPPASIPANPGERSRLFRTWCADRDMLIVLDDVASSVQIEPLIPGRGRWAVLVTTREHALPGTLTQPLGHMNVQEGLELLANIVGCRRVEIEPQAAKEIVRLCGGLPLAIRVAGVRLAGAPLSPLGKLARCLARPTTRLDELRVGDMDVRACFAGCYRRLSGPEKSAFRLLSLLEAREFSMVEASELLGCGGDAAEMLLDRLVDNHLLTVVGQNKGGTLDYAFPALTRAYARECLAQVVGGERPPGGAAGRVLALPAPAEHGLNLSLSNGLDDVAPEPPRPAAERALSRSSNGR